MSLTVLPTEATTWKTTTLPSRNFPSYDFGHLSIGDLIEARHGPKVHHRGPVEEALPGLGLFWIRDVTTSTRRLVDFDTFEVFVSRQSKPVLKPPEETVSVAMKLSDDHQTGPTNQHERMSRDMPEQHSCRRNWSILTPGDRITVKESGRPGYDATVDILTADAGVIWILPDVGSGRKAFDCREDIIISHIHEGNHDDQYSHRLCRA